MRVVTFASGSSGNCTLVTLGASHFLIDAGISYKRIREHLALSGLAPEELSGVLITHEHSDHICGLATLVKRCAVPVFAPREVAGALRCGVPGVEQNLRVVPAGEPFQLGGATVLPFHTPHDTPESVGWRLASEEDGIFALATDMGEVTEEIEAGLTGADAVLIEANHDVEMLKTGPYPVYLKKRILSDHGHLSNDDCALLAARLSESGTRYVILGHLSRENNTPRRAFDTVRAALDGKNTQLYVAPPTERLTLEIKTDRICLP